MDYHGITMKGKYFMEQVSTPTAGATNQRRIAYNTSNSINGVTNATYNPNKMIYHDDAKWLRPLVGNDHDAPDADNTWDLGSSSYRFRTIRAVNIYGAVRYS